MSVSIDSDLVSKATYLITGDPAVLESDTGSVLVPIDERGIDMPPSRLESLSDELGSVTLSGCGLGVRE